MADVIDDQQNFTITLLLQGYAVHGTVTGIPSTAYAGDVINAVLAAQNTGGADEMFVKLIDVDTSAVLGENRQTVLAGATANFNISFTMPAKTLNLRALYGHNDNR